MCFSWMRIKIFRYLFFLNFCYSEPTEAIHLLHDLSHVNKPLRITFSEMLTLMSQCQQLDSPLKLKLTGMSHDHTTTLTPIERRQGKGLLSNNPFTILSGIIPGE